LIKAIEFENFKGQTGMQELTGRDIFIGRNGIGKTTRIQTLGASLLGYIPGRDCGKNAADTFKFATGKSMSVGCKTDNGFMFSRTFEKKEKREKDGSTKISITESVTVAPSRGEKTDTQRKSRIAEEVGNFPVALDFQEFLSLSDTKRREFIFSLSPIRSDNWTRERLLRYLEENLLTLQLKVNNFEHYQIMVKMITEAMRQFPENYQFADGLQSMVDWVSKQRSFWDAKKKDAQGAVRSLTDQKLELENTDRDIAEKKKELDDLHNQLVDVEKKISTTEEQKKAYDKRENRIKELQDLIKNMPLLSKDTQDLDDKIAVLQVQIINPGDLTEETKPVKEKLITNKEQRELLEDKIRAVKDSLANINSAINALETALKQTQDLAGQCIVNPQLIKCPKDFTGFGTWVEQKKRAAQAEIDNLMDQENSLKAEMTSLTREAEELEKQQQDIMKRFQADLETNRRTQDGIAKLNQEKNDRLNQFNTDKEKMAGYKAELERLKSEDPQPIFSAPVEILQKQAEGIRNSIYDLKKTVEEKEKAKQAILLIQQSMVDNRRAEYKSLCLKSIADELGPKGVQGMLVEEILEPLREDIRTNLRTGDFNYEPYFQTKSDTGQDIFQFGWINEKGHRVNFDALSTGQQVIYLAALMLTIIDRAQPKTRMLILDNVNHCDKQNFIMLLDGLSKLADRLDNIILAGALAFEFDAPAEWKVWNLNEEGTVANERIA